jgi:hypothetical protein
MKLSKNIKKNIKMSHPIFKNSSALLVILFVGLNACTTQKNLGKTAPIAGYKLIWNDEFDDSQVDSAKWAFRTDVKHRSVQLREHHYLEARW